MLPRHRALLIVIAVAALLVAADATHSKMAAPIASAHGVAPAVYENAANVQTLKVDHQLQVLISPRADSSAYLQAIAKGERIREQHVVEDAAKATLARAKAEAAAAVAGQWQPWMSASGPNQAAAILPGVPNIGGYFLPARGVFTSGFGARWGTMHEGIDIAGPIGTPIYAVSSGTVINAGPASGFGLWVRIKHDDGTISVYGHLYDFFVSVGERVPGGMQIARMGNRGDSTGPHLHFEIIINGQHVDPQRWLALHGIKVG
ncbi:M23 family metallopeptidase [Skermania sp. ID1734]|uniref:M23 family metallopeptidase n=1 Tax=Skermania sp. ID1734 TaxID=2597516 RepID=UPI00351B3890